MSTLPSRLPASRAQGTPALGDASCGASQANRPSLVRLLAGGEWQRGPALARSLGISRAAVSARMKTLRALGLDIFSVPGRGYRLGTPLDLLDGPAIRAVLSAPAAAMLDDLIVEERLDSTNAALARIDDQATRACLAEYQTAGRGRGERRWASPFGVNLYLSVAHTMSAPRAPLGALGLAVGVALAETLAAMGVPGVQLKWPNDLLIDGAKLGGILIEHRGQAGGSARLIAGVGINLAMPADAARSIDQPWTRLADHMPVVPSRSLVAGRCLDAMLGALAEFADHGFEGFAARWTAFDTAQGKPVRLIEANRERLGVARGIGADGALRVEIDGLIHSVYSGDISLRLAT